MTDRDRCMARLAALYPALTEEQADRFGRYYTLLVDWNRTRNLTAITEPEAVAEKHFFDSLAAAPLLPAAARCIDVGTGAGFPGIPLLIVRPDLAMTLLDALQKRIDFLQAALEALGLAAQCLHLRAEDAGRDPALRASFDAALTRAVAPLPVLLELTVPLLSVGGQSVAYKGDPAAELAAAQNACAQLRCACACIPVPAAYGARALVVAKKLAETPARFPRRAGLPAKQPL